MPDPKELELAYQSFFLKNEHGKYCLSKIGEIIVDNHEKAEDNPELSRDYVQRARGAREALLSITNVFNSSSKKGAKKPE